MMLRSIRGWRVLSIGSLLAAAVFVAMTPAVAQNNQCDEPGEAPDVIVGSLHQVNDYGTVGGISAYSVGTVPCNIGTCMSEDVATGIATALASSDCISARNPQVVVMPSTPSSGSPICVASPT